MDAGVEVDPLDGVEVVQDLHWLITECEDRCLLEPITWASEILSYVPSQWVQQAVDREQEQKSTTPLSISLSVANRTVILGRSLMLARDFYRAEHYLSKTKDLNMKYLFLYFYCRYLKVTKENLENDVESLERKAADLEDDDEMSQLYCDMARAAADKEKPFDTFLHYLHGLVKRRLNLRDDAKVSFKESIKANPKFWPAFEELAAIIDDYEEASEVRDSANKHWYGEWFESRALPRLSFQALAISLCNKLAKQGLGGVPMLDVHAGACYSSVFEHEQAVARFSKAHDVDPFRIEDMETYSDSLWLMGDGVQLAALAHELFRSHKYHWQTCCAVSNYYSQRGEHEQSIRFLHRALRLNPVCSPSIWTLIGHEFLELKNYSAACMAYRKAVEIDPKSFRGWYGLGQMYDILKMTSYAAFYYQRAHNARPQDSRMLVALAEVYIKTGRVLDAEKCYIKAYKVGDVEGIALFSLAKHYEAHNHMDNAAVAFQKYLEVYHDSLDNERAPAALVFLAKYCLDMGQLDQAAEYAQKCCMYDTSADDGRALQRNIAKRRQDGNGRLNVTYMVDRGESHVTPRRPSLNLEDSPDNLREDILEEDEMAISDGEGDESF